MIAMISEEERLEFEAERLMRLCYSFGSLDMKEALRFGFEFNLDADKIVEHAERFSNDPGIPFEELTEEDIETILATGDIFASVKTKKEGKP